MVPLYIVSPSIGGTVIDVGSAASAFNLALIPGALFWGRVTDILGRRRLIVLLSYLAMAILLGTMYFTQTLSQLVLVYAAFGFASVGPNPAVSLLLMETTPKPRWSKMFARLSSISMVGLMLGSLPGALWTYFFDLKTYFLLCFVFTFLSLVTAYLWVPEPIITLERKVLAHLPESLAHRLLTLPMIFLKIPDLSDFRRFGRIIKGLTDELPLLYFSMFFFFTSASVFFTSYTPFLVSGGISNNEVFLAYFFIFLVNAIAFIIAGRTVSRFGEGRTALLAIAIRALAMLTGSVIALSLKEASLLIATLVLFVIVGSSFTFANTAVSTLIFRTLRAERQGELLGVYSALTGAGLFVGAYVSGFVSFHYGYPFTFAGAAALLGLALAIFRTFVRVTSR